MSEAAAALASQRFRAGATALATTLGTRTTAFRPLLGTAELGGFSAAGAGAGGPVKDMLSRLREVFDAATVEAAPEPEAAERSDAALEDALARARAEAFAAGEAEGRRSAEAAFGMRLATLDRLLAALAEERRIDPAELEAALGGAAIDLIACVLGAAPALARETIAPRVAEAAARLGERVGSARLRLHPDDLASLDGRVAWPAGLTVQADADIAPGGFVIAAGDSLVEDRIADRLARAAAALGEAA